MKILCAADIHIGRRPFVLSPDINAANATSSWHALVDYAIESKVDVVALAGDIVDRGNRYFEAIGALERGLARLATANIETVAIAGNHDCEALVRLRDTLDQHSACAGHFHLLGCGGVWEEHVVRSPTGSARFVGWSYPMERPSARPLADFVMPSDTTIPTIGLLHGDIDNNKSEYANFSKSDLSRFGVDAWVIGHIHIPGDFDSSYGPCRFYCGSLQGLDPSENGQRGAWLLDLEVGSEKRLTFVALAPIQFETVDVDVSAVSNDSSFQNALFLAIDKATDRAKPRVGTKPTDVSLRLKLTGATAAYSAVSDFKRRFEESDNKAILRGETTFHVDSISNCATPAYDLNELARMNDPPGVLARLLITLGDRSVDSPSLSRQLTPKLQDVQSYAKFQCLRDSERYKHSVDERLATDLLTSEGYRLLSVLMNGKSDA